MAIHFIYQTILEANQLNRVLDANIHPNTAETITILENKNKKPACYLSKMICT